MEASYEVPDVWIKFISIRNGVVQLEVLFDTMDMVSAAESKFREGDILKFFVMPRVAKKTKAYIERESV